MAQTSHIGKKSSAKNVNSLKNFGHKKGPGKNPGPFLLSNILYLYLEPILTTCTA